MIASHDALRYTDAWTIIKRLGPRPPIGTALVLSRAAVDAAAVIHADIHYAATINRLGPRPPIGTALVLSRTAVDTAAVIHADIHYAATINRLRPRDQTKIPVLVGYDPRASVRTREHEQLVATILNELIINQELIRETNESARGKWKIGYDAGVPHDWAGATAPTTLVEALDRIAAALRALGQSP